MADPLAQNYVQLPGGAVSPIDPDKVEAAKQAGMVILDPVSGGEAYRQQEYGNRPVEANLEAAARAIPLLGAATDYGLTASGLRTGNELKGLAEHNTTWPGTALGLVAPMAVSGGLGLLSKGAEAGEGLEALSAARAAPSLWGSITHGALEGGAYNVGLGINNTVTEDVFDNKPLTAEQLVGQMPADFLTGAAFGGSLSGILGVAAPFASKRLQSLSDRLSQVDQEVQEAVRQVPEAPLSGPAPTFRPYQPEGPIGQATRSVSSLGTDVLSEVQGIKDRALDLTLDNMQWSPKQQFELAKEMVSISGHLVKAGDEAASAEHFGLGSQFSAGLTPQKAYEAIYATANRMAELGTPAATRAAEHLDSLLENPAIFGDAAEVTAHLNAKMAPVFQDAERFGYKVPHGADVPEFSPNEKFLKIIAGDEHALPNALDNLKALHEAGSNVASELPTGELKARDFRAASEAAEKARLDEAEMIASTSAHTVPPPATKAEEKAAEAAAKEAAKEAPTFGEKAGKYVAKRLIGHLAYGAVAAPISHLLGSIVPGVGHMAGWMIARPLASRARRLAQNAVLGRSGEVIGPMLRRAGMATGAASTLVSEALTKSAGSAGRIGGMVGAEARLEVMRSRTDADSQAKHLADLTLPISTHAPTLAAHIQSVIAQKQNYLLSVAPQSKVTPTGMGPPPPYKPSPAELAKYQRIERAVWDPQSVLVDISKNRATPETIQALRATSPELYKAYGQEIQQQLATLSKPVDYKRQQQLSMYFGAPASTAMAMLPRQQATFAPTPPAPVKQGGPRAEGLDHLNLASRAAPGGQKSDR